MFLTMCLLTANLGFRRSKCKWIDVQILSKDIPLPVAKVNVRGNECLFIIDSGATNNCIDSDFALSIGIVPTSSTTFQSAQSEQAETSVCCETIDVCGKVVETEMLVIDLSNCCTDTMKVHGILSSSFIMNNSIVMDYHTMRMLVRK